MEVAPHLHASDDEEDCLQAGYRGTLHVDGRGVVHGVPAIIARLPFIDRFASCCLLLQSHPEEMELIMQLACRRQHSAQQQEQQPPAAADGEQQQQQQRGGAEGPGQRDKAVVVLVGATLDEPLVEHAVEQVGMLPSCRWMLAGWWRACLGWGARCMHC